MTSSGYAAVFFDAGETLVHPHPTFPDLFAEILRREGHDVSAETVRERGHVVFDRFREAAEANELWTTSPERSRRFWHDVYGIFLRELGIPDANGLIDVVYGEFTDLANYRLFDDVTPVLDRLRDAGLVLGVVSNFEEWLERLLEELGVRGYFQVSVVSGVEGFEKPDPRIFRLAMTRAGVTPGAFGLRGRQPGVRHRPGARGRHVPGADRPARTVLRRARRAHHRDGPAAGAARGRVMAEERLYEVDEANAMLPELRERLARIRDARQVILREAEVVKEQVVADGGGTHGGRAYWEASTTLRTELERLAADNILLRDPETGLVDFPAEREGERIYLCWRVGEEAVANWHPLDTGFSSRRPL